MGTALQSGEGNGFALRNTKAVVRAQACWNIVVLWYAQQTLGSKGVYYLGEKSNAESSEQQKPGAMDLGKGKGRYRWEKAV